jgi:hypothetical protein
MMSNQPVQEIRLGRIRATVWRNETENGARYSVVLTKLYKVADRWQDTGHFDRDDLPLVAKVVDLAHTWIFEQKEP